MLNSSTQSKSDEVGCSESDIGGFSASYRKEFEILNHWHYRFSCTDDEGSVRTYTKHRLCRHFSFFSIVVKVVSVQTQNHF